MTPEQLVEAFRFVAWSLELCCAIVAAQYVYHATNAQYRLGEELRVRVAIGICIKCSGWALHQFYWWVWQSAVNGGRIDLKNALEDKSWITILAYIMIFSGEALVISPWLARMFGRHWPSAAAFGIAVLWAFGSALATRLI